MIKEVKMYTVICDNCGKDCNADSEYSCWGDPSSVEESASDSDWVFSDKDHYCPNCASCDDEGNLVIKKLIVGEDMICPVTQKHCYDECCTVGSVCNVSGSALRGCSPDEIIS